MGRTQCRYHQHSAADEPTCSPEGKEERSQPTSTHKSSVPSLLRRRTHLCLIGDVASVSFAGLRTPPRQSRRLRWLCQPSPCPHQSRSEFPTCRRPLLDPLFRRPARLSFLRRGPPPPPQVRPPPQSPHPLPDCLLRRPPLPQS